MNIPDDTASMGGAMAFSGSEKVVLIYKGKENTYDELKELAIDYFIFFALIILSYNIS